VFLPRQFAHVWASAGEGAGKIINVYHPAGKMESFFREVGKFSVPPIHEALGVYGLQRLFQDHGMEPAGPPLLGEWRVDDGHDESSLFGMACNLNRHKAFRVLVATAGNCCAM
jgi:hypothetical protein